MIVYASLRLLPTSCQPCYVNRAYGDTLLYIDKRAQLRDVVAYTVARLTTDELNVFRAGFGEPPVGLPLADKWFEDGVVGVIPDDLLLPQESEDA